MKKGSTQKFFVATLLLAIALSQACLAENNTETDEPEKVRLWIGGSLILVGLATFMKTEEAVFFVVFASQGIAQIVEYLI